MHLLVGLAHLFPRPGVENRVVEIGDPIGGLPSGAVGNERMCRIVGEGGQLARNRTEHGAANTEPDARKPVKEAPQNVTASASTPAKVRRK